MNGRAKSWSVFLLVAGLLVCGGAPAWAQDCNSNGIPDECDIDCGEPSGPWGTPGFVIPSQGCLEVFDFDADADVDLTDFAGFQRAVAGTPE